MKGTPRTPEERIKALEMMSVMTMAEVSRKTKIPITTLIGWKNGRVKSAEEDRKAYEELRNEKKQQFIEKGWEIIQGAQDLLADQIAADKARPLEERKLRVQDLTNTMGVQYDKQALAQGDPTVNAGINISLGDGLDKFAE